MVEKISDEEWQRIKENANQIGDRLTHKELLERRRQHDAMIQKYGVKRNTQKTRIRANGKSKHKKRYIEVKPKKKTPTQKTAKPLYDSHGKDYYDYAGEYEARSVSFGYGRKKSKEWNGPILYGRITNGRSRRYPAQMRKQLSKLIREQNRNR